MYAVYNFKVTLNFVVIYKLGGIIDNHIRLKPINANVHACTCETDKTISTQTVAIADSILYCYQISRVMCLFRK